MSEDVLEVVGGRYRLQRPGGGGKELRAWDAADEQLIETLCTLAQPGESLAIVDDQFGALGLALDHYAPALVADSAKLAKALKINALKNNLVVPPLLSWLDPGLPAGGFDRILLRIPRQADYLAYLLRWANSALRNGGQLIAGGMIKHLPDRSADVFSGLVQTETVYPAKKKARVVVCSKGRETLANWPALWQGYHLEGSGLSVMALPAVFARNQLDIGTRCLLPHAEAAARDLPVGARLLDLACGNGVLGLAAMAAASSPRVDFADVSSQAVASAERNVEQNFPGRAAGFFHCDGVPEGEGGYDLILLNPPFHEAGVVGDHIARRLIRQASESLAPGGRLLLVGNRHLGYHVTLKKHFSRVRQLAASPKFVVFDGASG